MSSATGSLLSLTSLTSSGSSFGTPSPAPPGHASAVGSESPARKGVDVDHWIKSNFEHRENASPKEGTKKDTIGPEKKAGPFKGTQTVRGPDFGTLSMPSNPALCLLAERYSQKYGIQIFVMDGSEAAVQFLARWKEHPVPKQMGIIVAAATGDAHVTPVLCSAPEKGPPQVILLDSQGGGTGSPKILKNALEARFGTTVSISSNVLPRQADKASCRTDAITLLKNALRDLQQNQIDDPSAAGFVKQWEMGGPGWVTLSERWNHTGQVTPARMMEEFGVEDAPEDRKQPVHQRRIKDADGHVIGVVSETIEAFRDRYKVPVQVTTEVTFTDKGTKAIWDETAARNIYLAQKGIKNERALAKYMNAKQFSEEQIAEIVARRSGRG